MNASNPLKNNDVGIRTNSQYGRQSGVQAGPRILVIDHQPVDTLVISYYLQQCRCSFDVATTCAQAFSFIDQNFYDAVLVDIGVPDFDSTTLISNVRRNQPDGGSTKILAVSAFTFANDPRNYIGSGMDDYMTKPYYPPVLAQKLGLNDFPATGV